jgi:hypothetical protein
MVRIISSYYWRRIVLALAIFASLESPVCSSSDNVGGIGLNQASNVAFVNNPIHVGNDETSILDLTKKGGTTRSIVKRTYKLLHVQIIHRHGDRTPITPLKNESYWADALPDVTLLQKVAEGTTLLRDENAPLNTHSAGGRGPFGKLTTLGLLQMVELGSRLRDELELNLPEGENDEDDHHFKDDEGHVHHYHGKLFHSKHMALHRKRIKVISTDFPRTIQSVQALLLGMFPSANTSPTESVEIDVRHTMKMIPDPQPRRSTEQTLLEMELASRPHLVERELQMKDLAMRTTQALSTILGHGHEDVSFGIGEEKNEGKEANDDTITTTEKVTKSLPWAQLSEITTCLNVRDLLPAGVTKEDQETISSHAAWRWFENLRHPRLARLAMRDLMSEIIQNMSNRVNQESSLAMDSSTTKNNAAADDDDDDTLLHIYSAHDSTLIGLLCAFRLEQPASWPEYGSYLKVELIQVVETIQDDGVTENQQNNIKHYVRFSLNGQVLRCDWGLDKNNNIQPTEMVSLEHLMAVINEGHPHEDVHMDESTSKK